MNQIIEEIFNKNLAGKEFIYDFEIKQQGLYGIEITASAKSRRQNFISLRSFLKDDDLTLKIDNISFPKKSGKKGLFDSEAAWNGSKLKGLNKTILFLIELSPGKHQLNFLIEQKPKLETIKIFQIKETKISYLPQDNYPPQEGNRRPWLTVALVNLSLENLKIKALAKEGKKFLFFKRDDSDLKLIINGEIQKNQEPKSHKNWYWCGRTLKGESKIFEKEFSPKPDIYYIELWADRNPEMEEIKISIEESDDKRIPTVDNPEWTGFFIDDTEEMLLARVIYGESGGVSGLAKIAVAWSVKNRLEDKNGRFGDSYHQVILKENQYDSLWNEKICWKIKIPPIYDDELEKIAWEKSYQIAEKVIKEEIADPTKRANHFYSTYISKPFWADENKFTFSVDNFRFYKL